jgi:hypothetical protein
MLRLIYVTSLFAITSVAGAGVAYCVWLILDGDQNGLINLGKCLILFLYGSYRLKSILTRNYLIYRPWENSLTKGIKRAAHGLLSLGILLFVIAAIILPSLAIMDYLVWAEISMAMLLFSLFALEITNAFNSHQDVKS